MRHLLFLVAFLFLLSSCGPSTVNNITSQPGTSKLSAKEVLALAEGNTLFLHSPTEDTYTYFAPDGRLFGKDIYNNKDNGRWDVSQEAELCLQMGKWWYGDLKCYHLYTTAADKYYLANSAGVLEYSAEMLYGDSRSLYFEQKQKRKSYRKSVRKSSPAHSQKDTTETVESKPTPDTTYSQPHPTPYYGQKDVAQTIQSIARDCSNCNLAGTDLQKANLIEANLVGTNLSNANLKMANLRRADLQGANLKGANLTFANLPGANLRNADLRQANFHGANLIKADLRGANLEGAIFTEALLEGIQGM